MKAMKKIYAMLLVVVMVLGLSLTAFAAENYTISINNAVNGQTYSAYKIFDATYVNSTGTDTDDDGNTHIDNISYTISTGSAWYDTMAEYKQYEDDSDTEGYSPFAFTASASDDTVMVVTVANGKTVDAAALAKYLNTALATMSPAPTAAASETAAGTSVTLDVTTAGAGYYFVDTTLGTLCSLNTVTGTDVKIEEKNPETDIDKKVEEYSTGVLGETNNAGIGDTVNYTITIHAKPGAENYVLHDTMTAGLTFDSGSVVVKVGETALTADTDYTLVTGPTDGCTFEITFTQTYLDSITANTDIVVTYSATVNANAVIDSTGNTNTTKLTYGENGDVETTEKITTTYVYDIDILKYTPGENDTKTPLKDAEFVLYKTVTTGEGEGATTTTYYAQIENGKLTGWTTEKGEASKLISDTEGKISVDGLDADKYYLEETKAPDGYNPLTAPVEFVIDDDGNITGTGVVGNVIQVENNTGTELPSTGGIGTTIFYVVGSILVLGAAVLLIVKKRMNNVE